MSHAFISEDNIEKALIAKLSSGEFGYKVANFFSENPETNDQSGRSDKEECVLVKPLFDALVKINPDVPSDVLQEVVHECSELHLSEEPAKINHLFYSYLINGVEKRFLKNGEKQVALVKLVDFDHPENNQFLAVEQMWIKGPYYYRRPDVILFVNGLPLVWIELKNSTQKVKEAYDDNLLNYRNDIPHLFHWNQICVLSNACDTLIGSYNADFCFFYPWFKIKDEREQPDRNAIHDQGTSLEYLAESLFKKQSLLFYIRNFVLYEMGEKKIIAQNHQFLGVINAFETFKKREKLNGKLGVFWHTQGSGKSYSMVFLSRLIRSYLPGNFTFLIVTDREELDDQIYKTFVRTDTADPNSEGHPGSSFELREALKRNNSFVFTLIQKFKYDPGKEYPVLSNRNDIVVFVDEAHRTEYAQLAENMRHGLPNANFLAFTGTPLLGSEKKTYSWFGPIVSEYNFTQSVADGATVTIFYSNHVPHVLLQNQFLDPDFEKIVNDADLSDEERDRLLKRYPQTSLLQRDDVLDVIAKDIVCHLPERGFLGKAMIVDLDKITTVRLYEKVKKAWPEKIREYQTKLLSCQQGEEKERLKRIIDWMRSSEMAVVVSEDAGDVEEFKKHGLDFLPIHQRLHATHDVNGKSQDIEDDFKDPKNPFRIAFVCSMWLTGFDVPNLSTLYLVKPLVEHNLMQAITRVNRTFDGKKAGEIVDYVNIFKNLKDALGEYAAPESELQELPVKDIQHMVGLIEEAIGETIAYCDQLGISFDEIKEDGDTFENLSIFTHFRDILLGNDAYKDKFKVLANTIEGLYLASQPDIFQLKWKNPSLKKILYLKGIIEGSVRDDKIDDAQKKVDELLDISVQAGIKGNPKALTITPRDQVNLSKLDFESLKKAVRQSKTPNIAISDMRAFIEAKLAQMLVHNISRVSLADKYQKIIDDFNAGSSTTAETLEELLKFINALSAEQERTIKEGLSEDELEIYDLLKKEKLTKEEDLKVKKAAQDLLATLLKSQPTLLVVDWYKDTQPREKVYKTITAILNSDLPASYDRALFTEKRDKIFDRIVDRSRMGCLYSVPNAA
jgi:type I restriction enzyme, R subunit